MEGSLAEKGVSRGPKRGRKSPGSCILGRVGSGGSGGSGVSTPLTPSVSTPPTGSQYVVPTPTPVSGLRVGNSDGARGIIVPSPREGRVQGDRHRFREQTHRLPPTVPGRVSFSVVLGLLRSCFYRLFTHVNNNLSIMCMPIFINFVFL